MALRDQLQADLKEAMRAGDEARKTLIRGLMAALKEVEQRKRDDLTNRALKKHGVVRPIAAKNDDPAEMARFEADNAAYEKAVALALATEDVEAQIPLDEAEAVAVVQRLVKQRQESMDQARQANRADIAQAEEREMEMLQAYLPRQMTREELESEARAVISEVGASEARDMGKVMAPLMSRVQGRADGKMVSDVVRSLLAK